ncbi:MAG: permease-like cell division protein FtsX [Oscillospiraceae bacterium]|nr:permease-like cell division protein FtsX [Oscillospiraceae bacterium]
MNKIGYLIREGFLSIFTHGFMSFASICVIIACLVIMGSFSLLAVNIDSIIQDLEQQNQMVAFVDETLSEEDAAALLTQIAETPNVRDVQFVTREQARENYVSQYEDSALFEDIDGSVFRHRFVVYLDDISIMEQTQRNLYKIYGIADVQAHLDVANGFITVRNVISLVSLALVVVLVIVSVFIMANTIKLTTYGRREEIIIMKMVGASNSFIRFPFVVEGLILGLIGGGLAFLAEWGLYQLLTEKLMTGLIGNLVTIIPFNVLFLPMLCVYLLIGIVVGVFGSSIAIRKFLKV